ncbi:hypothetical protein C1Y40_00335 [Mycobacterium talmoniae]|uniref:Uncharacterized protein n=1 Tax=Mycobacterium talmoniae TaxID=1858794 RepID=A0A2S8BS36_9MYCO|nr:hypothetical protein C1Y40_00335 [Mycobacterium talmoniae]
MLGLRAFDQGRGDQRVGGAQPERRAVAGQHAHPAGRFAGMADPAAVEDHPVAEQRPLVTFDEFADGVFDLDRVLLGGPPPAPHQPPEVGVDGDAGDIEGIAEDDVGGFAAHPGQGDQLGHGGRHLPVEPFHQSLPEADQRGCLVTEETGGADEVFELGAVGLGVVQRGPIAGEQRRGGQVDALIGALRRQDGGHRQLERRGEVQLATHFRKRLRQCAIHPTGPAHQPDAGLFGPPPGQFVARGGGRRSSTGGRLGHGHLRQGTNS